MKADMDETSPSPAASTIPQTGFGKIDDLTSSVVAAIDGARTFLFSEQHEDGYWCGELEADTTLQYDYDAVPAIPPEIVLFPNWFWFNIYEISSWSRAILVPLSICYAKKPFKKIPDEMGVEELFVGGRDKARMHLHWAEKLISWRN